MDKSWVINNAYIISSIVLPGIDLSTIILQVDYKRSNNFLMTGCIHRVLVVVLS